MTDFDKAVTERIERFERVLAAFEAEESRDVHSGFLSLARLVRAAAAREAFRSSLVPSVISATRRCVFAQRASTALRAELLRSSAVSFLARAWPPLRPKDTAAAFFFGDIAQQLYHAGLCICT